MSPKLVGVFSIKAPHQIWKTKDNKRIQIVLRKSEVEYEKNILEMAAFGN